MFIHLLQLASLHKCDFSLQQCSSWQDFNWQSASPSPGVIAEILVNNSLKYYILVWCYVHTQIQKKRALLAHILAQFVGKSVRTHFFIGLPCNMSWELTCTRLAVRRIRCLCDSPWGRQLKCNKSKHLHFSSSDWYVSCSIYLLRFCYRAMYTVEQKWTQFFHAHCINNIKCARKTVVLLIFDIFMNSSM